MNKYILFTAVIINMVISNTHAIFCPDIRLDTTQSSKPIQLTDSMSCFILKAASEGKITVKYSSTTQNNYCTDTNNTTISPITTPEPSCYSRKYYYLTDSIINEIKLGLFLGPDFSDARCMDPNFYANNTGYCNSVGSRNHQDTATLEWFPGCAQQDSSNSNCSASAIFNRFQKVKYKIESENIYIINGRKLKSKNYHNALYYKRKKSG